MHTKRIKHTYLDAAATVPMDPRVLRTMRPYMSLKGFVGNSAAIHNEGIQANIIVEAMRFQISEVLKVNHQEVYFTSGATESNNWVLKSLALHELSTKGNKKHIVVSAYEHSSILNTCKELEKLGFKITYIKPNGSGRISARSISLAITDKTLLVCVMAVNNELGVENPIEAIGKIVHRKGSLLLSDYTQALSYGGDSVCLDKYPHVDYFSFSGHKIYGPLGVGALIVRKGAPIYSLITGGSQENGLRGGTMNVPGIIGLNEALHLISKTSYDKYFNNLYEYLVSKLPEVEGEINVKPDHKNIVSCNFVRYINVDNLAVMLGNYDVSVSAGSACEASLIEDDEHFNPSATLVSIDLPEKKIRNTIRISFSKYTKKRDIDVLIDGLKMVKKDVK